MKSREIAAAVREADYLEVVARHSEISAIALDRALRSLACIRSALCKRLAIAEAWEREDQRHQEPVHGR